MSGQDFVAHVFLPLRRAFVMLATVLALVPLAPCGADEVAHRPPVVLMLVDSSTRSNNALLGALIADSFKVELESQGIRVLPADEPAADDRTIAYLAQKKHADFALCALYTLAGSEIQLDARWIDPAERKAVGKASRKGMLNLSFDSVVAGLVDEIVTSQKTRFADLPPEEPKALPVSPAAPQLVAGGTAVPVSNNLPAVTTVVQAPRAEPRIEPFSLSVQSAPFIATFTALNYFPVGLSFSLTGMYRVKAPGGLFGFGLSSGLSGFHGKGAYAEADFWIIPVGIDFLYGTRTGSAIDFFAHLGGGPAVFAAKLTTGESLAKVIPYAGGGVGILLSLFDSVAVSLEAGYTCFFDSPDPIMGFTPSLSVLVRL